MMPKGSQVDGHYRKRPSLREDCGDSYAIQKNLRNFFPNEVP